MGLHCRYTLWFNQKMGIFSHKHTVPSSTALIDTFFPFGDFHMILISLTELSLMNLSFNWHTSLQRCAVHCWDSRIAHPPQPQNSLVHFTLMVTSDMARTKPAAGLTVNSTGLACRSLAALPCQSFLNNSDNCLALVTLGDPNPSPRTRRAKVIGTMDVLKRVQIDVCGKPAHRDRDR